MSDFRTLIPVLDDGYRCDDLTGVPLLGNAPTAIWVGTPLQDTSGGGIGNAWRFNGTNAVEIPDFTFGYVPKGAGFAIAFRGRVDGIPNDGSSVCLIKRGHGGTGGNGAEYQLAAYKLGGVLSIVLYVWNEAGTLRSVVATGGASGTWFSGVAGYDRAHLLLDLNGTLFTGDSMTDDVRRGNAFVQIGRELDDSDGSPAQYMTGAMDELYWLTRWLTAGERAAIRADRPFTFGTREGLAPVAILIEQRVEADPAAGESVYVQEARNDAGRGRFKRTARETISDVLTDIYGSVSLDDGRSYGPTVPLLAGTVNYPGGGLQENDSVGWRFDPASGLFLRLRGVTFTLDSHNYYKTFLQGSPTGGKDWPLTGDTLHNWPLNYELPAPAFDPNSTIHNTDWKENNNANPGSTLWLCANGDLITACGGCRDPITGMWGSALGTDSLGARLFRFRWNPGTHQYDTVSVSNAVSMPFALTTYGLSEAATAELSDGRILVLFRNDNTEFPGTAPQGLYVCVGTAGGATLSQPVLLTFDDGAAFHAPSATPFLIRLPGNDKLYFVGNVNPLASGQTPRWPFIAAEIDETLSVPAPKRATYTRLRRRAADEPAEIQFSNATIILNLDGWTVEIDLTTRGDLGSGDPSHGRAVHHEWRFMDEPAGVSGLDAAADFFFIDRAGATWNRKLERFELYDAARKEDFAVGRTAGEPGRLPNVGTGRFTIRQFGIETGKLGPGSGDVALGSFSLDVSLPDPPKGSASVLTGPAGTASVR